MMIKNEPEAVEDDKFEDSFGSNDSGWDQPSKSSNFENIFSTCPGAKEAQDSGAHVHQVQAVSLELKEEEVDIEEHKSGYWELIGERNNAGIFTGGLDQCDSQENEVQSSESKNEVEVKYWCAYCPYKTNKKSNYVQHYFCNHHNQQYTKMYKCEECSYETKRKCDLTKHFKYIHAKKPYMHKCQECSYKTKYKSDLSKHKFKHAKEAEVYKCPECSFKTRYKGAWTEHYKYKHAEGEVYKCQECYSYETRRRRNLTAHYKHSKDGEVYKCQECSLETRYKCAWTKHYKDKHQTEAQVYKYHE